MPAPQAILFDWDNTLVDNWPTIHRALNAALEGMGQAPWTFEETLASVRQSMRDSFPRMFGDRWQEAREIFYATFRESHLKELQTVDGAEQALQSLKEAGIPLGVVSNKTGTLLRSEAEHLGWVKYFGPLVGAGDAAQDKPDPAPIVMALDSLGVPASGDVWYVGDAAIDIVCAHASGCRGILISAGRLHPEEAIDPTPDRHVNTFRELVTLAVNRQITI